MEQYKALWDLSLQTFNSFRPHYKMAMVAVIKATGVNKSWFALYLARGCDPEPFTLDVYRHLNPHDSPLMLQARIDDLVEKDFLQETDDPGHYRLTKSGRKAIKRIFTIAHREIGKIQTIPFRDIRRVADLMEYVVAAAMRAPEPLNKWSLHTSRWTDIGGTGPAPTRIDQYITDLRRFENDCRIASWAHHGISGIAWETLGIIGDGQADSPETLAAYRQSGFTVNDYLEALNDLCDRGWITFDSASGAFQLSPQGRAIRAEAERVATTLFYTPWQKALHADELDELEYLFKQVLQHLAQIAA